jgi:hypothetical protein
MRVYGHLRDKHSAEMATKVTFVAAGKPAGEHTASLDAQPPAVQQVEAKSD